MRKAKGILGIVAVLFLVLVSCSSADAGVEWKPVNFKVTSHLSTKHNLYTNFYDKVAKYVTEKTGGAVTFDVFWAGELVELGGETDALISGVVDMAWPISPVYEATKMPISEVTVLPLTNSDSSIASEAWRLMLENDTPIADGKTYYDYMFGQNGLKVFAPVISETYVMATTKIAFDNVPAIKALKMRTAARPQTMYTNAIGCANVTLPGADVFDALNRGTIDGAVMWVADWPNFGLEKQFKYAMEGLNLGHFPSVFAMSQKGWDALQPELQNLIIEAIDLYRVEGSKAIVETTQQVKKTATESGVSFIHVDNLSADVKALLTTAMAKTWTDYIAQLEGENRPGKIICQIWKDCVIKAGGAVPEGVNP